MKGFLPWLVRWVCRGGSNDFYSALAALVGPIPVLGIRIRDPVPFWPLGKKFYNSFKNGPNFFLQHFQNKIILNFVKFVATKKGMTTNFFSPLSFLRFFLSRMIPGSGMGKKSGSRINIPDPQHCPIQNIFFLTVLYFNSIEPHPIAHQAGQAAVLGRLYLSVGVSGHEWQTRFLSTVTHLIYLSCYFTFTLHLIC